MTFAKKGIVIPIGGAGEIDNAGAYLPAPLLFNDKIYLYYCAFDGVSYRIALAISKNGTNFIKKGVVLYPGGAGNPDTNGIYMISPIVFNNKIYLYHEVLKGANYRVSLAISDDGTNFVKKGVVIPVGAGGTFDNISAFNCGAILFNDKIYLYYGGYDGGAHYYQGLAVSDDGVNFIKKGIVIPLGGAGTIDDVHTLGGVPLLLNNKIYLYYTARDGNQYKNALAISDNGVNFVKKGIIIPIGGAGTIDDKYVFIGAPIIINNKIYYYYSAHDDNNFRTALAISEDGF